jgi:hypothetical protein
MPAAQADNAARAGRSKTIVKKDDCQNAEGVGEMAEVRTRAAE